jgi:hypothetical protein
LLVSIMKGSNDCFTGLKPIALAFFCMIKTFSNKLANFRADCFHPVTLVNQIGFQPLVLARSVT